MASLLSERLAAFVAVAEQGTVHGAARAMGLTQTAMTRRIQLLEDTVQASLFLRSRRGMQLTREGRALLRYAERVQAMEAEALAHVRGQEVERAEHLVIVAPSSLVTTRIAPMLVNLTRTHALLTVEIRVEDSLPTIDALRRNAADFAIAKPEDVTPEFQSRLLRPERYIAVGPTQWAARSFEQIVEEERIIDFDSRDDLTFSFLRKVGLFARCRRDRHLMNNTHALASCIQSGVGYSVLAEEFAAPLIATGDLTNLAPGKFLGVRSAIAYFERRYPSQAFQSLLTAISRA